MGKRLTQEEFIRRAREVHGDKYGYSKVEFVNIRTKVCITCPIHGDFFQTAKNHMNGQGCPECGRLVAQQRGDITVKNHRKSTDEFIKDVEGIYGDRYTVLGEYVNNKTPIQMYCNSLDCNGEPHGEFYVKPNGLLSGHGCHKCGVERQQNSWKNKPKKEKVLKEKKLSKRIVTFDVFKERLEGKVGDSFQIDRKDFLNMSIKIPVVCNECGAKFYRKPTALLNYVSTCPECNKETYVKKRFRTLEDYVRQASLVHNNYYSYEHAEYKGSSKHIIVTCPEHGDFSIEANSHLQGHGCPLHYCNHSKQEVGLREFIEGLVGKDDCVYNSRSITDDGKEIDIFIKSKNIAIEYDGLYWHNELNKETNYHLKKTEACQKKGIELIHIFEDEWLNKRHIVESMLKHKLGMSSQKVFGRKCVIKNVDSKEASLFLDQNHLQGRCGGNYRIGLYDEEGKLVSLMVFGKSRHFIGHNEDKWELVRFANRIDTSVVGGASRLFKHFLKEKKPNNVVSYADKRISQGTIYERLGFSKYGESKPNYYYVVGDRRVYRFNLRKRVLIEKYGCDPKQSERDFCLAQKWYRIYDCGCLCYEWKNGNE